jgi:hypothetical protein
LFPFQESGIAGADTCKAPVRSSPPIKPIDHAPTVELASSAACPGCLSALVSPEAYKSPAFIAVLVVSVLSVALLQCCCYCTTASCCTEVSTATSRTHLVQVQQALFSPSAAVVCRTGSRSGASRRARCAWRSSMLGNWAKTLHHRNVRFTEFVNKFVSHLRAGKLCFARMKHS